MDALLTAALREARERYAELAATHGADGAPRRIGITVWPLRRDGREVAAYTAAGTDGEGLEELLPELHETVEDFHALIARWERDGRAVCHGRISAEHWASDRYYGEFGEAVALSVTTP